MSRRRTDNTAIRRITEHALRVAPAGVAPSRKGGAK